MPEIREILILTGIFASVFFLLYPLARYFSARKEMSENLRSFQHGLNPDADISRIPANEFISTSDIEIRHYFETVNTKLPESLEFRLIQAGYCAPSAGFYFTVIRGTLAVLVFGAANFAAGYFLTDASRTSQLLISAVVAAIVFVGSTAWLDRRTKMNKVAYRKLFPEFMDLLIVCVDAGLSLEAALDRITREYLQMHRNFGLHLAIMMLEVRAGRRLRDALSNFAKRIDLEEVRSLATLFRQSEELGASVIRTLRVFSKEMRQKRMIRAEEKANALPVKMLFPLAMFLFPTNLIIVLTPILIAVVKMFESMSTLG